MRWGFEVRGLVVFVTLVTLCLAARPSAVACRDDVGPRSPSHDAAQVGQWAALVENRGQFARDVRFVLPLANGRLWLTDDALWLSVLETPQESESWPSDGTIDGAALRLDFVGANTTARLEPFAAEGGRVSYLLGEDRAGWTVGAGRWAGVRYRELYPGIDLVIEPGTAPDQLIPWRFEALPGADLETVRL